MAVNGFQGRCIKDVRDQAQSRMSQNRAIGDGADPRRLLPAMLLSIDSEICQVGRFGMTVNTEESAILSDSIQPLYLNSINTFASALQIQRMRAKPSRH